MYGERGTELENQRLDAVVLVDDLDEEVAEPRQRTLGLVDSPLDLLSLARALLQRASEPLPQVPSCES